MTAALPAFPGSRVLAGWWRQLAYLQPRRLWVVYLDLDRVDALVRLRQQHPLDRFTILVLRGLARPKGATLEELDRQFGLGRQFLAQVARSLAQEGLACVDAGGCWSATTPGRDALAHGHFARRRCERRSFYFIRDEAPPRFLHVTPRFLAPRNVDEVHALERPVLEACVAQSAKWKSEHHFPVDVEALAADVPEWARVLVVHPESVLLAIVESPSGGESRVLSYAIHPENWKLHLDEPVFSLGADWRETFPCLADPSMAECQRAWVAWSQSRNLPRAEIEACRVETQEGRLCVHATHALMGRLRASRSEALKGEAWVLAGSGRQRLAAQIDLRDAPA